MLLPDNTLLSKITKQSSYYDKKSSEAHTGRVKPKYKLAGNCVLENYLFHVFTTSKGACKKSCTIKLSPDDWEDVTPSFETRLMECYCDVRKIDIIGRDDLLSKIKDTENGFPYVGRLKDDRYGAVLGRGRWVGENRGFPQETVDLIQQCLSENIDELLSDLGLN